MAPLTIFLFEVEMKQDLLKKKMFATLFDNNRYFSNYISIFAYIIKYK